MNTELSRTPKEILGIGQVLYFHDTFLKELFSWVESLRKDFMQTAQYFKMEMSLGPSVSLFQTLSYSSW